MDQSKVYFPNLNGLRFFAALMVIIHHIEQDKLFLHFPSFWAQTAVTHNWYLEFPFIFIIGKLGVVLFFVLSGFLITYLLLTEESIYSVINIRKFYIRRILRIWPLYFLIFIISYLILPHIHASLIPGYGKDVIYQDLGIKVILFVFFLPNVAVSLYSFIPYTSHIWSIGAEEQYYVLWPMFFRFIKTNRVLKMGLLVLLYMFITKVLHSPKSDFLPYKFTISIFWNELFCIDCMVIGSIFAALLSQKSMLLQYLMNKYFFYGIIILTVFFIAIGFGIPLYTFEFYALLFGIIILNFAANKKIRISLENRVFDYLGKISFGLYMYHYLCIPFCIKIVNHFNIFNNVTVYLFSISSTIIIASLSHYYFERPFIKLKARFSNIRSGNSI